MELTQRELNEIIENSLIEFNNETDEYKESFY